MWILSEDRTDTILVGRFKREGGNQSKITYKKL